MWRGTSECFWSSSPPHSRVKLEVRRGCSGLCTVGVWLALRMEIAASLGKSVPVFALTVLLFFFFSSLLYLEFLLLKPVFLLLFFVHLQEELGFILLLSIRFLKALRCPFSPHVEQHQLSLSKSFSSQLSPAWPCFTDLGFSSIVVPETRF